MGKIITQMYSNTVYTNMKQLTAFASTFDDVNCKTFANSESKKLRRRGTYL